MVAYLKHWNGTPTGFIDGKPVFMGIDQGPRPTPAGWPSAEQGKLLCGAGIHLYSFDVGTGPTNEWCGPGPGRSGDWDFSQMRASYGKILDVDPTAHFFLRMYVEITQPWWLERYPEERELDSKGVRGLQSFASTVWRDQTVAFLQEYVAQLRANGLDDRVFAWQIGTGSCSEWVKGEQSMKAACGDYSAPMRREFCAWLSAKYAGDVDALRRAWADAAVTFESAEVPSGLEQLNTKHGMFRDPRAERKVIDYYECLAELCADRLIAFGRSVKEASHGTTLTGAFYGYLMELAWHASFFGDGHDDLYGTIQRCGHLGLRKVLRSPYIDFLSSPFAYGFRGIGGFSPAMQPTESLRVHGKVYFFEDDIRTYTAPPDAGYGRVDTLPDSIATLRRNFCDVLVHGHGIWWSPDGNSVNPLLEPAFLPELQRYQELGAFGLQLDRQPSAEIAVLLDDESFFYETVRNDLDTPLIFQQKLWGIPKIGAPHDIYLLQDFLEGRIKPYKLYIFLNAFHLDNKRRAQLAQELHRDGKVAVWIYAPGYLKDEPGLEHMTDLTGIKFDKGEHAWGPLVHILDFTHPITQGLRQDLFWGTNARLEPVFHVEDPEARTLGQVVYSQGRCKPGFVLKEFHAPSFPQRRESSWSSIYIAAPNIPAPVLRGIARWAGVHLYNELGDVLYATPQLLGVHTVSGGARVFALPRTAEVVYDLFEKQVLAENADAFTAQLPERSTQLYFVGERRLLAQLPEFHP